MRSFSTLSLPPCRYAKVRHSKLGCHAGGQRLHGIFCRKSMFDFTGHTVHLDNVVALVLPAHSNAAHSGILVAAVLFRQDGAMGREPVIRTGLPSGTGSDLSFIWTVSAHKKSGPIVADGAASVMYSVVASTPQKLLALLGWRNTLVFWAVSSGPGHLFQNLG